MVPVAFLLLIAVFVYRDVVVIIGEQSLAILHSRSYELCHEIFDCLVPILRVFWCIVKNKLYCLMM